MLLNSPFSIYNLDSIKLREDIQGVKNAFLEALHPGSITNFPIDFPEEIENKNNFRYFFEYLYNDKKGLQVKTILVEENYTSLSYLTDYLTYYATAYRNYPKTCKRIHFFKKTIEDRSMFVDMIVNDQEDKYSSIWDSYCGCIVIRPLPQGYIGNTLLKPYDSKIGRFFPVVRNYGVNLFGKQLSLGTLLYQEQDGIISNCATSSIRFANEKLNNLFQTPILAPSEITIAAGDNLNRTGKKFPSSKLEISQVCKAIGNIGLYSEFRVDSEKTRVSEKFLKAFVYSYLRMGIPILFGIEMEDVDDDTLHMVTLSGYRFDESVETKDDIVSVNLLSDCISRFYCHDDQTGSFSRLIFNKSQLNNPKYQFTTSIWKSLRNSNDNRQLEGDFNCLIVPLKKNISVVFEDILEEIIITNSILQDILFEGKIEITWDIYLSKSNDYKNEILKEVGENGEKLDEDSILFQSLPQYIWVSKAYFIDDKERFLLFDFIYDAIDVNLQFSPYSTNIYNSSFKELLQGENESVNSDNSDKNFLEILGYFDENPSDNIVRRFDANSDYLENSELDEFKAKQIIAPPSPKRNK